MSVVQSDMVKPDDIVSREAEMFLSKSLVQKDYLRVKVSLQLQGSLCSGSVKVSRRVIYLYYSAV